MEGAPPGLVEVMECGVGQLQHVSVSKWTCINCLLHECIDSCAVIPCSDLPPLTNGMITYSAGESTGIILVGSTATHSCGNSYFLVGEAVRTCGNDGRWSETAPVCQKRKKN